MAQEYKRAEELLVRDEEKPFERRSFMLLLLASPLTAFDAAHADINAVLKPERNQDAGRYALRTQVIRDPTRPLGNGAEILQFFMLDPNHDRTLRGQQAGVIYEVADGAATPLVLLTAGEVDLLAYGEGYATPLRR
jgi:hypothetical protein